MGEKSAIIQLKYFVFTTWIEYVINIKTDKEMMKSASDF